MNKRCLVAGCESPIRAKGKCVKHRAIELERFCNVCDCKKPEKAKGMCSMHLYRFNKHGDVHKTLSAPPSQPMLFIEKMLGESPAACVDWPFAKSTGYGKVRENGKLRMVSHVVLERTVGPMPNPGMYAIHSCNRGHLGCVSPACISWGTPKQNALDMAKAGNRVSKLTPHLVKLIRQDSRDAASVAADFGVSESHILRVKNYQAWDWVE